MVAKTLFILFLLTRAESITMEAADWLKQGNTAILRDRDLSQSTVS